MLYFKICCSVHKIMKVGYIYMDMPVGEGQASICIEYLRGIHKILIHSMPEGNIV